MADKENTQITPSSTEPDNNESKTYSGKFTSVEELEKGYGELEKTTAANNERLADFEKRLEDLDEASVRTTPATETTRETAPTKTDYLAKFYADPEGTLAERDKAVEARTLAAVDTKYQAQRMMDTYYHDNPDLSKHEDLLEFQFAKTSPKLKVQDRLDQAGKKVRDMLASTKDTKEPGSGEVTPDNYVEGPSGEHEKVVLKKEEVLSPDAELKLFLKERSDAYAKTITPPSLSK